MSSASDISNLFQMLGVSPSHYQEVERTEQVQGLRGRWSTQTEPSPLIGSTVAAAASGSLPVMQAAADHPVLLSNPEPVIAAQQPDTLSAVFERLRERNESPADALQRQTS